jgi:hypothetical protein
VRAAVKIGVLGGAALVVAVALGVRLATPRSKAQKPPAVEEPKTPAPSAPDPEPTPPRPVALDASVPTTAPATHTAPKKAAAAKPRLLAESELMARLRKAQDTDEYMLSYDLAREGLRRFPDSPDAPEMAAMVVKSLARQGKISEARAEAEVMVNKYVGTHWAREVERHTGAHPIRNQVPPR